MEELTHRQEAILQFVTRFAEKNKIPPTVREIQKHFGFESTNAVADHLLQLEKKGHLKRRPGIARGLELKTQSISFHPQVVRVPWVGQIAAGAPVLAEENIEGYLHLDKTLIRGDGHFLLKVRGDSMKDAGIHNGDFVLVKKQDHAERGDIVAAYLDEEATVKYFWPTRVGARRAVPLQLRPANHAFRPISVTKEKYPDFRILGKVKAVLRIYADRN